MKCKTCLDTYGVATDAEERRWRTLCSCERETRCATCNRFKATHAFLDDLGEVDRYACNKHGVAAADREGVETREGPGMAPAAQPPKKPKTRAEVPAEPVHDLLTLSGFKAAIKTSTSLMLCEVCHTRHLLRDAKAVMDDYGIPDPRCPKCGSDRRKYIGEEKR